MKLAAIALCAGLSRRMGSQNKLLLDFNGKMLCMHVLERIVNVDFAKKLIVTNYAEIKQYGEAQGWTIVENPESAQGISTSIKRGIESAGLADGYMFFHCDQPLLREMVIQKMLDIFQKTDKIIVPVYKNHCYSPCIFPARFKTELMALTGDIGGKVVYRKHLAEVEYVHFVDVADFMDIDVMTDKEKLLQQRKCKQS